MIKDYGKTHMYKKKQLLRKMSKIVIQDAALYTVYWMGNVDISESEKKNNLNMHLRLNELV